MHRLYKKAYPTNKVSLSSYKKIFYNNFNISFGYPRCDTCSTCDAYIVKCKEIQNELSACAGDDRKSEIVKEQNELRVQQEIHKRKADTFYVRKRGAKNRAKDDSTYLAIAMDFCKNLPCPNIPTNDVYYKRQLSFYAFNIHVLSTSASYFYTYDETIGKKGADDVCSFLANFLDNEVTETVKEVHIFCDSCAGQNKNYTVFRFLHSLVGERFQKISMTFPVRGHSYLECDKNMGLISTKGTVETPDDWRDRILNSRVHPSPFVVKNCDQSMFKSYSKYLKPDYKNSCPFATRPIKDFIVTENRPNEVLCRYNYNGTFEPCTIKKKITKNRTRRNSQLQALYSGPLPLNIKKYNDIQSLVRFCSRKAAEYFSNLSHVNQNETDNESNDCGDDNK